MATTPLHVTSLGEAVNQLAVDSFVGRKRELARFREWLGSNAAIPGILNVTGPSGVGKSRLLQKFRQVARQRGRKVLLIDGANVAATPGGLLRALGGTTKSDLAGVIARIDRDRPLILLDTFEQMGDLTPYLQHELLPRLPTSARIVIASRFSLGLAWTRDPVWNEIIHPVQLHGFSPSECREYLRRRGLRDGRLIDHVVKAAGPNTLALSLAADLVIRFGVRDLPSAPEWRMVVHRLVDRFLDEVADPELRDLLEASIAVRQFDEAALAAISGRNDIRDAFRRLCELSFVSSAEHGLMLHDDVRRRLTDDLAWRHPDRYAALRARALTYYRDRVRMATPDEREWLVADRFYLWGNALIQDLFFASDQPGQIWVDVYRRPDYADVRRLFDARNWSLKQLEGVVGEIDAPPEDSDLLDAILASAAARVRVARDRDGRVVGFSTNLLVGSETIPLLAAHPVYAALLEAFSKAAPENDAATRAGAGNVWCLIHLQPGGVDPGAARAALLRDLASIFATGGIYLASTFAPGSKRMLETFGFEKLPLARNEAYGASNPVDGYVLDLATIGFEPWIEAIMNGRRPPRPIHREVIESELHQALRHWTDDGWLASSRLAELPAVCSNGDPACPGAIRRAISEMLTVAREEATDAQGAAYRAVELMYLSKHSSHKRCAQTLAVSRATLYRLVRRGIQGLAEALGNPNY